MAAERAPPPSPATSGTLAVVGDPRASHHPAGCAGVFFQLLDWNRRLAGRKLFARRLPHPRPVKRIEKSAFAAGERLPASKLLLIADENMGGFPAAGKADAEDVHCDGSKRMCNPSLVARLMGLDSMPAANATHDRTIQVVDDDDDDGGGASTRASLFDDSDTSSSSRRSRHPQQQQRTGLCDGLSVTTAGEISAAPPFNRSSLACQRKCHPNPPSPLQSPRLRRKTSSALLMEAAAMLLEPKSQRKRRGRSSLIYQSAPELNPSHPPLENPAELGDSSFGRSCVNCGNLDHGGSSPSSSDISRNSSSAPIFPEKDRRRQERKPRREAPVPRSTPRQKTSARSNEPPLSRAEEIRTEPSSSIGRRRMRNPPPSDPGKSIEKKPLTGKRRSPSIPAPAITKKKASVGRGGGDVTPGESYETKATMEPSGGNDAAPSGSPPAEKDSGEAADALTALLEQKIKQLSHLGRDDSVAGILEELISALTAAKFSEPQICLEDDFQASRKQGPSPEILLSAEDDQPSPLSVFEASFSNDGSSISSSSGHRSSIAFPEISIIAGGWAPALPPPPPSPPPQPLFPAVDWIVSHPELVSGRGVLHRALEILVDFYREGQSEREEMELRRFLFDCIVEHVDVNAGGQREWGKISRWGSEKLAAEVNGEMTAWRRMAGKGLDEIVRWDLNRTDERWFDSDSEALTAGVEIENLLMQLLVNEVALDLLSC